MKGKTHCQRGFVHRLILAPYSLWALLFILVPLAFVAYYAFTDSNFNFTLDNISRFFTATSTTSNLRSLTNDTAGVILLASCTNKGYLIFILCS